MRGNSEALARARMLASTGRVEAKEGIVNDGKGKYLAMNLILMMDGSNEAMNQKEAITWSS